MRLVHAIQILMGVAILTTTIVLYRRVEVVAEQVSEVLGQVRPDEEGWRGETSRALQEIREGLRLLTEENVRAAQGDGPRSWLYPR